MTPAAAMLAARLERGISQRELARRSGVAQPNIAAFESGARQPTLYSLERLAEGLGLGLSRLSSPLPSLKLDRHALDRLCRCLVRNEPSKAPAPREVFDDLCACFHSKLKALYPGISRRRPRLSANRAHRRLEALLGRKGFEDLAARLEKAYPWGRA